MPSVDLRSGCASSMRNRDYAQRLPISIFGPSGRSLMVGIRLLHLVDKYARAPGVVIGFRRGYLDIA